MDRKRDWLFKFVRTNSIIFSPLSNCLSCFLHLTRKIQIKIRIQPNIANCRKPLTDRRPGALFVRTNLELNKGDE